MDIGKYSYGEPILHKWTETANIKVGKFCSLANNVHIYSDNGIGHDISFVTTYPFGQVYTEIFPDVVNNSKNTNGDVIIGNDVWICENVRILSGVKIGDGAVVANNSHVIKNVEPYSVVGGNPAKHIKYRFSEEQIKNLLEIKWWDWEEEKINSMMHLLLSSNIDDFINSAKNVG